jgi:energy-coupling factor transport system ATP-binding protein
VREVDLRIEHGERVLLLGASGAGKSTLLAALAGLLAADSGEQEGEVVLDPTGAARAVGIVFQDPQTQLVMGRAGDDVAFGLENLGVAREEIWPRVRAALAGVGFPYELDRRTDRLSGGEQQRLAIAGVLAMRPGVVLLDEPTANLDPAGAALVRDVLRGLRETMILVEHRVAEALPTVDRVVALSPDGGLLADGTPEKVFAMYGTELAEAGVWVPDATHVARKGSGAGAALLTAPLTEVRAGEALAVTGPNGAGKTTLALELGGLSRSAVRATPALDADPYPYRWRAGKLATRIGSVFQNPEHQFVTSSVAAELALGGASPATVDALLTRLRLDRLAPANPYTLSGGEQRRLSVATALAAAPSVVILDEPTFGQDLRTWRELVELIADLRDEGRAMVLVTHDADLVATVADREVRL